MSKLLSHATSVSLPSSILALMLLHKADAIGTHRVLILSAASSSALDRLELKSNCENIDTVSYKSVASVIRQLCQGSSPSVESPKPNHATFSTNAVATSRTGGNTRKGCNSQRNHTNGNAGRKLFKDALRDYKLRAACPRCGRYGHCGSIIHKRSVLVIT